MASYALPAIANGGRYGIDHYLREIQKFPMLHPEEEYMLAKRYTDHMDMSAAHRLVTSHLRLVVKIAHTFKGYGLPLAEMVSEGNIGLMQAVKRFDPERGFRLSTYAMWWIKAAIQEYVLRSWSLVKMGTSLAQKKLFFNLKRMKHRLREIDDNTDLTPDEVQRIAAELDVPEQDVVEMNHRMIASDRPLNATVSMDGDGEWMDLLADDRELHDVLISDEQERVMRSNALMSAMKDLNEREQDILRKRRLMEPPVTLEELSQEYGVSRERVRQIEGRAFEKLQAVMMKALPAPKAA